MHAELVAQGHECRENTVARLMRDAGIAAKTARKYRPTRDSNHPLPVAANVLDRPFDPPARNESWVAHMTDIPTRERATAGIFEYIETFDNRVRRHSTRGDVSPADFDAAHPG
ncbi:Mobile element protein [Fimbriiglobus ruber]|uniref:Mobile element protein n=1 Tax=Fimbriiglobus ruber TaxID=1908690 RepID=A0A225DMF7_9BACT|nr:Mobile element protein [Fimbriiglobus ruber]